jgi:sporulation protein YlmC with PRC-barrel domain
MFDRQRNARASAAKTDYPLSGTLLGARSLIEDDVYDATGKRLGEIEDIVLDARTGCVRYAVVALGGFLGVGCKRFAVPWSALTPDSNYRRCVLNVAQMRLMAVPISNDDRRSHANPIWGGKISAH